jgi:diacylglycerol kinase family enzyme
MNAKYIILYNPLSGNKSAKQEVYKLDDILANNDLNYVEMTPDFDYKSFMNKVAADERVVLCGGDGTINRFINEVDESDLKKPVFYFPLGSGNDFNRDIHGKPDTVLININNYITNLPTVTINGKSQKFINGIGYGIDGWCCEMGDKLRAKDSTKPINYTAIAIKGALFQYKKTNARVTVDGKEYHYKDVFLASTMKGRFYGGGMMAAPDQDRNNPDHTVSVLVFRGKIRLQVLLVFSKIFTGEHLKKPKMCILHTGKDIKVSFDSPRAVQVDGETVLGVSEYTVKA